MFKRAVTELVGQACRHPLLRPGAVRWSRTWRRGLENLFRELGAPGVELDPATLPALAARYGCQVDFQATAPILQRHGLRF